MGCAIFLSDSSMSIASRPRATAGVSSGGSAGKITLICLPRCSAASLIDAAQCLWMLRARSRTAELFRSAASDPKAAGEAGQVGHKLRRLRPGAVGPHCSIVATASTRMAAVGPIRLTWSGGPRCRVRFARHWQPVSPTPSIARKLPGSARRYQTSRSSQSSAAWPSTLCNSWVAVARSP